MKLFFLCGKAPGSLPHVLSGWFALVRSRQMLRQNASFQVLFLKMLTNLRLADSAPNLKPLYESP